MTTTPRLTDESLLLAAASTGDHAAITRLYKRHAPLLHACATGHGFDRDEAEDIVSETMLAWLRQLPHFEDRGIPLRHYLLRIAHARITDRQRRWARRPVALWDSLPDRHAAPAEQVVAREAHQQLVQALATLTAQQREVVVRRFLRQQSLAAVAAAVGQSLTATKSLQHRGLRQLRRVLTVGKPTRR